MDPVIALFFIIVGFSMGKFTHNKFGELMSDRVLSLGFWLLTYTCVFISHGIMIHATLFFLIAAISNTLSFYKKHKIYPWQKSK